MTLVHLHGSLGVRFGGPFDLELGSVREVGRALGLQLPGFLAELAAGTWLVVRDREQMTQDSLDLPAGAELHLIPAPEGAGGKGGALTMIAVGALLIGASFLIPGSGFVIAGMAVSASAAATMTTVAFSMGFSLMLGGISGLLAPDPPSGKASKGSSLMGGAVNVAEQGVPVPVVYGTLRVGSVVVSASLNAVNEI